MSESPLRVGYVPEHFSTPLHYARKHFSADFVPKPFPAGTGAMVAALQQNELDVAIGLTEGWVAGLARAAAARKQPDYNLVGTFVESPLRWAVSTGAKREDLATEQDPTDWVKNLNGKKLGVSRTGSGSYVMGFVMADKLGWLSEGNEAKPFEVVELQDFKNLREGVKTGQADFFMWEHFTSKRYYDNGEIRKIGEIMTPWPSWHIVAKPEITEEGRLEEFFGLLDKGIQYFLEKPEEDVEYISTELDYSKDDAEEWLQTVQFANGVKGVRASAVDDTVTVLKKASVIEESVQGDGMIKIKRSEPGILSALTG